MASVDVVMPKMGESVMEGTVLTWFKKPGEHVDADETLLEIGTDKVDSEIPSPASGVLGEILVPEGETVAVGTVLAVLDTEGVEGEAPSTDSSGSAQPDAAPEPATESEPTPAAEPSSSPPAAPEHSSSTTSSVEVVMPKMGESVMEGTILTWFKKPGEEVATDETLLEIGTDKVDSEIPSPAAGTLQEILVAEGETVEVGTVLARIGAEGTVSTGPQSPSAGPEPRPASEPAKRTVPAVPAAQASPEIRGDGAQTATTGPIERHGPDGRFYSPLVRSIAEREGLTMSDLQSITGSGKSGRVTKKDLLSYLETRQERTPSAPPGPAVVTGLASDAETRVEIVEMDRMRQVIAEHMTRSLATSAHVTSFAEADVTNLARLREEKKHSFEEREGVRLTYTPFFVRAAVDALHTHPLLNASVDGSQIILKKDFHIGIAVAIERTGLVVPVIRHAGGMNIAGLARAAADLAERARTKKLQPDELQGGTFTVTNVGSLGSIMGTPIINQPQVAILATGAIRKRPVVVEDPDLGDIIAIRHMMYLSMTYDHRIIDGAMGASFLREVVQNLESITPDDPV
jgi:2-oxoglutarate dehydrogenase E2 component (dihydrolipoamide succinyltransferase)